jgi:Xaa-Pro dipeptidase
VHLGELYSDRTLRCAATGFDALVIHAGAPPMQFLDDQAYPYKVNPHFKAWVPIVDNPGCILIYVPGRAPLVLFHRPEDYWHKPASVPHEPWTRHVEITPLADPATEGAAHWTGLGRVAFIGPSGRVSRRGGGQPQQSRSAPRSCTTTGP